MSLPSQHGSSRSSALLILALAAVAIAGCGSSHSSGTEADPAGAVPASTPLYAGATVRSGEPLKAAARAAGRTLTHQADPYLRLLGALQTPGSPALDVQARRGAVAGSPRRDIPQLAGRLRKRASAACSRCFSRVSSVGRRPRARSRSAPRASGGDRARHERRRQGPLLPRRPGQARAGAHAATYRGVSYQAGSGRHRLRRRRPLRGDRQRVGAAQRDRHRRSADHRSHARPATQSCSPPPRPAFSPTSTRTAGASGEGVRIAGIAGVCRACSRCSPARAC